MPNSRRKTRATAHQESSPPSPIPDDPQVVPEEVYDELPDHGSLESEEDELESEDDHKLDDIYMSDHSEHTQGPVSVPSMVSEVIAECPTAALKFRITDPVIIAKAAKKREEKAKAAAKKAEAKKRKGKLADEGDTSRGPGEEEVKDKKRRKKEGSSGDLGENSNDEPDEPDAVDLTFYVYIEKPTVPTRKSKIPDTEKYIQKGPFKFKSTETYGAFLVRISKVLPCPVLNIVEKKTTWRFQTPQNSPSMPLGGPTGFSAMIESVAAKRTGTRVAIIMMPPPIKPAEETHWDTGNAEHATENKFDYAELEARSTEDSIAQQRSHFNQTVGPLVNQLKEKYLIDADARFPGKRVYVDNTTGWAWDLTEMRLNVWASHIVRQQATIDRPPASKHFDKAAALVPTAGNHLATVASISVESHGTPNVPAPAPIVVPAAPVAPAPTSSTPDLLGLLVASMIQQQQAALVQQQQAALVQQQQASLSARSQLPPPVSAPLDNTQNSLTVPSSHAEKPAPSIAITLPVPNISLDDFCARYQIDQKDKDRLEKLEFRPGDSIDDLDAEEWKIFGGFPALSWGRIKAKNRQFLEDVHSGRWSN